jgi:hypothetical protein
VYLRIELVDGFYVLGRKAFRILGIGDASQTDVFRPLQQNDGRLLQGGAYLPCNSNSDGLI